MNNMSIRKLLFLGLQTAILFCGNHVAGQTAAAAWKASTSRKAIKGARYQSVSDGNDHRSLQSSIAFEYDISNAYRHGKGSKKKGKGKRRTAAPSISSQPSISVVPSSKPSLSLMPSSNPSSRPTSKPSVGPTSEPTSSPSMKPSLSPSSKPSYKPTSVPSSPPTNRPTSSSSPSTAPSISNMPSYDIIGINEVIQNESGQEIGTKSGCAAPDGINSSRYAEEVITEVKVEFVYLVKIKEQEQESDNENAKNEILQSLDYDMQSFVFENYVECQGLLSSSRRRKNRERQMQQLPNGEFYNTELPMAVSSLPSETVSTEVGCAENIPGEQCVVVDGGVSLYFEKEASVNPSYEENLLLLFLKDAMDKGGIRRDLRETFGTDVDDRILGLVFVSGKNLQFDRGETLVGSLFLDDDSLSNSNPILSLTGGIIIASAIIVLIGLFAAGVKRRRTTRYSRNNPAVLDILDKDYDGHFDDQDTYEFNSLSPSRKSRNLQFSTNEYHNQGKKDSNYFPISLMETRNGQCFPVSREIVNEDHAKTQDVHYCKSSLCMECNRSSGNRVKFIPSIDEIEGDFDSSRSYDRVSDGTLDFSKPQMAQRSYDTKNTVSL